MWSKNFQDRLAAWTQLRAVCATLDTHQCLSAINSWWGEYPWTAYYLHWSDYNQWPDPWQLLEENRLCGLAKGLGILYTISMLERQDLEDACLVETDQDNLVLVCQRKYILNWGMDSVVNTSPTDIKKQHHRISLVELQQRIR